MAFAHNEDKSKVEVYSTEEIDTKLDSKSNSDHTHDDRYYTESEIDTKLGNKANLSHTHDDRYYTETEINTKLSGKSDTNHNHDSRYYTETEVNSLLNARLLPVGATILRYNTANNGGMGYGTWNYTGSVDLNVSTSGGVILNTYYIYERTA